jgi:hypothetical protein
MMAVLLCISASLVWTYAPKPMTAASSITTTDDQPVVDWVGKHAVRLQTAEAAMASRTCNR